MLDNTPNQPTKFRTKYLVGMNDGSCGVYNAGCQIEFKTLMLRSSLYDYSDAYIYFKKTITVENTGTAAASNNKKKKKEN